MISVLRCTTYGHQKRLLFRRVRQQSRALVIGDVVKADRRR